MKLIANQSGFTLAELLVVLIIISVLSSIAIVRFVSIKDEAELARVESTAGAFKAAVKSVQITFNIQSLSTRIQNLPNFGSGNVDTNNIGYPIGIDKGNGNENIGRGNAGCAGIWQGILETSDDVGTGANNDYQSYRHTGNRVCSYVYRSGGDTAGRNSAEFVIQYDSRDGKVYVCGSKSKLAACPF